MSKSGKSWTGGKGKGKAIPSPGRVSLSTKAGVVFPVGRIRRYLKAGCHQLRCSQIVQSNKLSVYLAGVLEYLMAELLELAGNCAIDHKKVRIIPRHIQLAIRNDPELDRLLAKIVIIEGGVVPHIHASLLRNPKGQGSRATTEESDFI
ncbi:histone H2A putative [Mycena rebaudengoi]|nr:histone H2A putative [Mycena rebaudengoi]